MITKDKVTEIFCIIDEFDKNLSAELAKNLRLPSHNSDGKRYRNRKGRLSESEIMTILVCYHFGTYCNFKEYYLKVTIYDITLFLAITSILSYILLISISCLSFLL